MRTRIGNFWEHLRSGYWFLPAVMAAIAFALSFLMIALDERVSRGFLASLDWLYKNKPDGARAVLSTIAGSMITVSGVVFSVTIVALSLTSSQFGPHVLRSFMRDRGNQIVLGTFISTFLYSLMVLRTIRSGEDEAFVPHFALSFAVLLAIASVGVLIFFIHHSSQSIQGPIIIARIAEELNHTIERVFPEPTGKDVAFDNEPVSARIQRLLPHDFAQDSKAITACTEGHLQAIGRETILEIGSEHDLVIQVIKRPGEFTAPGDVLARFLPGAKVSEDVLKALCDAFIIGATRTNEQDVEMPAEQLAEIAVRALSPGINDPYTAMDCINRLGAGLRKMAGRTMLLPDRYDKQNKLRVLAAPVELSEMLKAAFEQIVHFGKSNPAVLLCVLKTLGQIAPHVRRDEDRIAIQRMASSISRSGHDNIPEEFRSGLEGQFQEVMQCLTPKTG